MDRLPQVPQLPARPPVLLSMPHWFGTLAAVRDLGRRGIDVYVASNQRLSPGSWSRYVKGVLHCPPEADGAAYACWLLQVGRGKGLALCRTSDDTAWIHAEYAAELTTASYHLASAPIRSLHALLDKQKLHSQAAEVGICTPKSFFPHDLTELRALARSASGPLLIKQRIQVSSRTLSKGVVVRDLAELEEAYAAFRQRNQVAEELSERYADVDRPMLQEYLPESSGRIYCLAGFLTPSGEFATRAALKILSHPRHLGIGMLFEHAEVDPDLEARLIRLCRHTGYHGIFQCEFLEHGGERLLIDFNPRYYNYMAFDHARGLPQAYLAYLLATGAHQELAEEIARARVVPPDAAETVYAYRLGAWTQLRIERLRGMKDETQHWLEWSRRAGRVVDPVWDQEDRAPALADVLRQAYAAVRHPRSFLRRNSARP